MGVGAPCRWPTRWRLMN